MERLGKGAGGRSLETPLVLGEGEAEGGGGGAGVAGVWDVEDAEVAERAGWGAVEEGPGGRGGSTNWRCRSCKCSPAPQGRKWVTNDTGTLQK